MSLNHVLAGVVLIVTLITIVLAVYKVTVRNLRKRMVTAHATQALKTSAESYWEEKRQDPRIGIVWPVSLETSQGEVKAKIKDLSLGGAFIACRDPLSLKEQFNLTINLPDQKPLTLVSEVVWSNSNVPDDKIIIRGMGIRFTQNKAEDRKSLNHAIVSYLEKYEES